MIVRYMPNSGHGGPPGTRVITIFVFYVSAQLPNIEYFDVYGGLWAPKNSKKNNVEKVITRVKKCPQT